MPTAPLNFVSEPKSPSPGTNRVAPNQTVPNQRTFPSPFSSWKPAQVALDRDVERGERPSPLSCVGWRE